MSDRVFNILFLCTGNSARSVMAESTAMALGKGRLRAFSAGSHPTGQVNPFALELLEKSKLPTDGLRSKSWDAFATPAAPRMDFIITVCDNAAGEVCPRWPGAPVSAHWGVPDPAAVEGPDETRRAAFSKALATLKRRIELLLELPIGKLDAMSLQHQLKDIGSVR